MDYNSSIRCTCTHVHVHVHACKICYGLKVKTPQINFEAQIYSLHCHVGSAANQTKIMQEEKWLPLNLFQIPT